MVKKVQSYTAEFRAEAVKVVLAQGLTLQETSQRISVPKGTLANWVANAGLLPFTPPALWPSTRYPELS